MIHGLEYGLWCWCWVLSESINKIVAVYYVCLEKAEYNRLLVLICHLLKTVIFYRWDLNGFMFMDISIFIALLLSGSDVKKILNYQYHYVGFWNYPQKFQRYWIDKICTHTRIHLTFPLEQTFISILLHGWTWSSQFY